MWGLTMEVSRLKKLKPEKEGNRAYECPLCSQGSIEVEHDVYYGKCSNCRATLIDYVPLPHQEAFHLSKAQYRANIGGYGSGKTTAACYETARQALEIPNGRGLITAPVLTQVREAVLPELRKFIPPWFIEKYTDKPNPYYRLNNGHELLVFASNDQQKLRSLNLTEFYIEEASGVDYEIFDQLMTRLRNKAAIVRDAEGNELDYKFMGIISSNPEDGWIRDNFLLVSSDIVGSKSIDTDVYRVLQDKAKISPHFHTFLSSTRDNHYLPNEYIARMGAGKSAAWVAKYIDCYLGLKEGLVYPEFKDHLVEPFAIPNDWKMFTLASFDPGYNDPTAFLKASVDPVNNVVYVYYEYKEAEKPIGYHMEQITKALEGYNLLYPIQADPSIKQRNNRDGVSYGEYIRRLYDVRMEPANNDILFGIEKVRDYMYAGKLKFFNDLTKTIEEFSSYGYVSRAKGINSGDTPVDRNNHIMDALRYMISILPKDPTELSSVVNKFSVFGSPFEERSGRDIWTRDSISKNADEPLRTVVGGLKKL
jgi:phage terminase large subunit